MRKLTYKGIAKRLIELDNYATYVERKTVECTLEYLGHDERDFYTFCYNLQRLYEKSHENGKKSLEMEKVAELMANYYDSVGRDISILDSMKTHRLYNIVIST